MLTQLLVQVNGERSDAAVATAQWAFERALGPGFEVELHTECSFIPGPYFGATDDAAAFVDVHGPVPRAPPPPMRLVSRLQPRTQAMAVRRSSPRPGQGAGDPAGRPFLCIASSSTRRGLSLRDPAAGARCAGSAPLGPPPRRPSIVRGRPPASRRGGAGLRGAASAPQLSPLRGRSRPEEGRSRPATGRGAPAGCGGAGAAADRRWSGPLKRALRVEVGRLLREFLGVPPDRFYVRFDNDPEPPPPAVAGEAGEATASSRAVPSGCELMAAKVAAATATSSGGQEARAAALRRERLSAPVADMREALRSRR